jgi:predicted translin family RNA/ssDNA-binding protein
MLLRNLVLRTARRLATDPQARERAVGLARQAEPGVKKAVKEVRSISRADDPAREMGRLVGRLKRKYIDDADEG